VTPRHWASFSDQANQHSLEDNIRIFQVCFIYGTLAKFQPNKMLTFYVYCGLVSLNTFFTRDSCTGRYCWLLIAY